ncbi:MAG: hypothetical protein QN193_08550 [Armatimonadota bacterium]|nr:hypothetical protein [Armatimonadota bacterium]MDR7570643.1 hypothetical protein [Armatimonadota bacterium]MDR7615291.1 hypothetical protein [Armatimonadota bacterium]
MLVTQAREKFDAEGRLVDEATRNRIREFLAALKAWTLRLHAAEVPVERSRG